MEAKLGKLGQKDLMGFYLKTSKQLVQAICSSWPMLGLVTPDGLCSGSTCD